MDEDYVTMAEVPHVLVSDVERYEYCSVALCLCLSPQSQVFDFSGIGLICHIE